jgi:ribosomal protein S26
MTLTRNPAIPKWNQDHRNLVLKTRKINKLLEDLKNFEQQIKVQFENSSELGPRDEATLLVNLTSNIKKEIFKLIDDTAINSFFFAKCINHIQQARNEITASWNYKQNVMHLLFCIEKTCNKNFFCLHCNSFFNDRSKLVETIDDFKKSVSILNN